ncbi:MAG: chemotaxis protein CheC [Deltaproteobacteria bacterium]|nr:MAG: chemotaxis protein CheC [Deltaproteobacteria bacterium]
MDNSEILISDEERDILQEVMNIAFGKASADLAEVIDIYVVLSIPDIKLMKTAEVPSYIESEIDDLQNISVIKQSYTGKFHGTALLFFPGEAGKKLFSLFDNAHNGEDISVVLQKETLLEVGNILIGASVSKVAELLDDVVSYRPPRIIVESRPVDIVDWDLAEPEGPAILMRTVFSFDKRDISGLLFLIPSYKSFEWLKKALHAFLKQYE